MLVILFAEKDLYSPCGMFTKGHIVLLVLSLLCLGGLLYFSRNFTSDKVYEVTRGIAILVTCLESIKIGFNFLNGYTWLDAWVPVSFCSIFIYATWLSGYGNGRLKKMGDAYIVGTAAVAGLAFILFPTTSLMSYPMWHFLSIHSMLFHTLMMYLGILYLRNLNIKLNKDTFCSFVWIFAIFAIIALVLNTVYGSNLMLIREPYNIPIPKLQQIHQASPVGYTIVAVASYLLLPFAVTTFVRSRAHVQEQEDTINAHFHH